MDFFGTQLDAVGIVRLRLGEHALHSWDVAEHLDPEATVAEDAAALLIDNVPGFLAPRLGKPLDQPFSVRITTTDPARDYLLTSGDSVTMTDWPNGDAASGQAASGQAAGGDVPHVTMPAEALLRLSYGRLDPEHTPASVSGDTEALDRLRLIFPGF
jgi:MDMPI C-terminal domain